MQLFIRLINNALIVIDVNPFQTIMDVKSIIYKRCPNMPVPPPNKGSFELTRPPWHHYVLHDDYSIDQYNITNEQTLTMIYKSPRNVSNTVA